MILESLAKKYQTDKYDHGYIPFYEKHLPKDPKRILEIGVNEGRSLAMWHKYFPNAEIFGVDLFTEINHETVYRNIDYYSNGEWDLNKVTLITGNQCDWEMLERLRNYDFDVIIDDGSHNSRDQLMTFFGLYNGKHYFIEDLQCNHEDYYSQGLPAPMRAVNIFRQFPMNGVIMDCQSPIVLINNLKP